MRRQVGCTGQGIQCGRGTCFARTTDMFSDSMATAAKLLVVTGFLLGALVDGQALGTFCLSDSLCDSLCCSVSNSQCKTFGDIPNGSNCTTLSGCDCESGNCFNVLGTITRFCTACPNNEDTCGDPHMQGLRGQTIEWSGVDGGWYCLVKDDAINLHVNVRLTAPLPDDFPDRQLITGISVLSEGYSLVVEARNAYNTVTKGCLGGEHLCLADGGLRVTVNGVEVNDLLRPAKETHFTDRMSLTASNLPVECRQFGGDKFWARMYQEMLQGQRTLTSTVSTFEEWVLQFENMAAHDWCTKYIAERGGLADVQSNHAMFKIRTPDVVVRLAAGVNQQGGDGEVHWDGRVLPDLEFWQMDVGVHGLTLEHDTLSGILGETSRPVVDKHGNDVMEGDDAFRGTVEDYRVSDALGTEFSLVHKSM